MTSFIQDIDNMTLCIPRVFSNIGEKRIRSVFYALKLGHIGRIDIVSKITERGEKFNRVFIHFERWFDTDNAYRALNLLREGKDIKVIYDEPWFWKVSTYRKPVHTNRVAFREQRNTRPYIQEEPNVPERHDAVQPATPKPVEEVIGNQEEPNYDSSVPLLDYKAAPVPKRTKLIPKKHKLSIVVPDELEDGEIVE
jgi:hypothetical protein